MSAGPDGVRDPVPNNFAASKAGTLIGFSGSSVRPIVISFSSFIPASTRGSGGDRQTPGPRHARHRDPCRMGHPVAQSRPKPRGGSIAWSSERSSSTIARKASASALSCWLSGNASSQAAYSACNSHGRGDGVVPALDPGAPVGGAACADNRCASRVRGAIARLTFGAGHGCLHRSMDGAWFHSQSLRDV